GRLLDIARSGENNCPYGALPGLFLFPEVSPMFKPTLCVSAFLAAAVLPLLAGCDSSSKKVAVSGTVTYDGQPVEYGTIVFANSGGPTSGGEIKDGKYSVKDVTPGKNV